jgi:hypothetical protein
MQAEFQVCFSWFKVCFESVKFIQTQFLRLFLHTISDATDLPPHIVAYSTVVTYNLVRDDIEEELLDRFMRLAKPRIDSERYLLLQVLINLYEN